MKLRKLINVLEFFYPPKYAENWDNVGLLIGDERRDVSRILTTLEITNDVIDEAIERKIDVIIAHHPIIFKPINNLNFKDPYVRMYVKLIKNNIAVYAMHTNVDIAPNGMNDWLAEILEMKQLSVLSPTHTINEMKLELECLDAEVSKAIEILKKVGIGQKGQYIENMAMSPKMRCKTNLSKDEEKNKVILIEANFNEELVGKINYELTKNNLKTFNIIKLENSHASIGIGKVGFVKHQSLESLAEKLKQLYSLKKVKIVGDREQIISKVAIIGGSGSDYIKKAKILGCDALITGDIGFHDAQLAIASQIALIDPGHNIEIVFNDAMAELINMIDDVTAVSSEIDTDPFEII